MPSDADNCKKQIDELLSLPHQIWLLGAGISKNSGIPLMCPLTERVQEILQGKDQTDFRAIREQLPSDAHVEHVLSHLGDLMAIAARSRDPAVTLGKMTRSLEELRDLHAQVQQAIRDTIRWGYFPKDGKIDEKVGDAAKPIVCVDHHVQFIRALFGKRRAGLERRPPVAFFTTNYDTLLEDAIALCRIPAVDGFRGGAMAFWDPSQFVYNSRPESIAGPVQAQVYKLHGSIDWFISAEDIVVRRREGAGYPVDEPGRLLIYPQATKYQVTQKDPFATLFAHFRSALTAEDSGLLVICGYSFGDDHINEEIERALRQRSNRLTVLAFCCQPSTETLPADQGLPAALVRWIQSIDSPWKDRVIVAGARGVYHGSLVNACPATHDAPHQWWNFDGLIQLLNDGPKVGA